jgi:integrase
MVRTTNRLSSLVIGRAKRIGYYADGGGLYLQVAGGAAKSWIFRFALRGKAREMGLGSAADMPLAEARERAGECRRLLRDGIDPIEQRKVERARAILADAKALTFKACGEAYIISHRPGWKNAKHAEQWTSTLATYAYPVFGALPVQAVDVGLVMKVVEPIWTVKPETASRVRGRIESVLDWATVRGYRQGDNPARWRGALQSLLPARSKVRKVVHHVALPYAQAGAFTAALQAQDGTASRALEFLVLTATRTSETIGARWAEIDLDESTWTIPAGRIKAAKEHRVPLSTPAVALLKGLRQTTTGEFVFPGAKAGKPLSNMAMAAALKRMGRDDITVHGFRSTFRDWAAEQTNYPREVAEMALAHAVGDKVEAAYRRGDLFEKRRRLMAEWARYCDTVGKAGKVVPIRGASA